MRVAREIGQRMCFAGEIGQICCLDSCQIDWTLRVAREIGQRGCLYKLLERLDREDVFVSCKRYWTDMAY